MNTRVIARRALTNRVERLVRLHKTNAPVHILANEAVLILKALSMLNPAEVGQSLGTMLGQAARTGMARCITCDEGEVERPKTLCETCWAEAEREAEEMEDPTETN